MCMHEPKVYNNFYKKYFKIIMVSLVVLCSCNQYGITVKVVILMVVTVILLIVLVVTVIMVILVMVVTVIMVILVMVVTVIVVIAKVVIVLWYTCTCRNDCSCKSG